MKYIGGSKTDGAYVYNLTNVRIKNAYPRSTLEAVFAKERVSFNQICTLGELKISTQKYPYRKLLVYTNFIAPSRESDQNRIYSPKLANMAPKTTIAVPSDKTTRDFIKKRISENFWQTPYFPYVTDEPKVKASVKSRPKPSLDLDKTFNYAVVKKGKLDLLEPKQNLARQKHN